MYFNIISLLCLIVLINSISGQLTMNNEFGKYKMSISNIELCKGAKKSNLTTSHIEFKNVDNILYGNGNYTLSKEVGPVMFKGKLLKWSGKRYDQLLKYKSDEICEFSAIRQNEFESIAIFSSVADKVCTLQKGTKVLNNVDLTKLWTYLLGESYFYGQYKMVMEYFTTEGNIICFNSVFTLNK